MQPQDWQAIWLSLKVGFFCLALIGLPGIAVGWLLARRDFVGKTVFEALVHAPLVLPPVVTGYLLLVVCGREGWLGQWLYDWFGISMAFNFFGAVLAASVVSFPLMVRSTRLGFELMDPKLEIAAATLGASPFRVFRTITFPLSIPGVLTGLVLAFVRSIGEFGATITFAGNIEGQTRTLPLAVYTYLQIPGRENAVWMLSLVAVLLSLAALIYSERLSQRRQAGLRGRP